MEKYKRNFISNALVRTDFIKDINNITKDLPKKIIDYISKRYPKSDSKDTFSGKIILPQDESLGEVSNIKGWENTEMNEAYHKKHLRKRPACIAHI